MDDVVVGRRYGAFVKLHRDVSYRSFPSSPQLTASSSEMNSPEKSYPPYHARSKPRKLHTPP